MFSFVFHSFHQCLNPEGFPCG